VLLKAHKKLPFFRKVLVNILFVTCCIAYIKSLHKSMHSTRLAGRGKRERKMAGRSRTCSGHLVASSPRRGHEARAGRCNFFLSTCGSKRRRFGLYSFSFFFFFRTKSIFIFFFFQKRFYFG